MRRTNTLLITCALLLMLVPGVAQAGPLAIIGNSLDGTVTVIDTAVSVTNTASPSNVTVTATITLTSTPVAGIAANPVRAEAYIAALTNEGVSVLTVFGTNPLAQIIEIPLGVFEPIGVAVNPAGNRAYVTGGLTDNVVSVVNLDTRAEIATITLHPTDPVGPYGVAIHPSQPRLYVGNSNSGTISVINTTTNAIVTTITLAPCPDPCAPNKAAVSPDGTRLYVTDDFADVVWVINTVNNTIVTSVPLGPLSFPEGVAVHPDGSKIYVAHLGANGAGQVSEIDTDTNMVTTSARVGADPIGVAVDASGTNVFVVNYGDDTVTAASTADLTSQVVLPVGGAPATFGQFITAAVTGSIQFSSGNYSVNEPLTGTANAVVTVTRTGAPGATILVPFTTTAGTATPGALGTGDYAEITQRTLTFGPTTTSLTVNIPIFADATAEGPQTVNLLLGTPTGLANLGTPSTAVTFVDVSGGSVQFSSATYSVNEAGTGGTATSASIVVTRTGGTAGGVTVDYTTRDLVPPEAQGGVDYTITSGTLTFAAGVPSLTFPVPILNDNLPEGNERFEVVLSNPSAGARLGSTSISKVTIQDDEVVLQFDATAYTVSEDGTKATITVERSGPPGSTVTVQYATSNGTATGGATAATLGADYVTTSGTLTFGPTITKQTFTVTIVNDFVIEPDETLTLTLSNPGVVGTGTAPILGPRNPATLTITNDDKAGTIEFSAGTYTVSEAAGTAAIVVSRTGGLAEGVTVTFATSAGTATPGDDYTETTTTLTFAGGEAIKTVLVPIVNDSIVEPNETVSLTLSSPGGGGTLGARSTAVLTIISDDQPGVIEFSAATYSVNESAGPAKIIVTRTGGTASNVTVSYATSDGTAVAPGDYAATSGTLTFGAGVSSLTFLVPIVNDSDGEGPETVNLTLSNPGGGAALGPKKLAVLTILDDEPTVQFAAAEFVGMEGAAGVITVTRTGPLTGTATVRYTASDDTAVVFRDYSATSGILTFPPNIASKTFTVPITDGSILEPDEFVTLTLSTPTGAVLGNQKVSRLRIRDNDPGTLKLSAAAYSVPEKVTGQKVVISVQRTGSLNATTTVLFQTIDGTATGGPVAVPGVTDYVSVSTTLTFTPGVTKIDVPITIVDDTLAEGNETFIVRLGERDPVTGVVTGVTNGTVNPRVLGEATVTIVDDDKAGTVQFKQAAFTVPEPISGTATAEITVIRTGGTAGPAAVAFSTADGTATAGEDYIAFSGMLTFAFNEMTKTFQVPILADNVIEGTETVRLTLSNPIGGLALGPQSTAILSIVESTSVLQFGQLVYTVSESTPMATITVVRSGSLAGVATVRFRTLDGTATTPADYGNRSGMLTFAAGSATPQTFTIPIVNDDLFEGDQTVNLVLSDPVGAVLGQLSTSTLVITDNDLPGTVAFPSATFAVSESAGTAKITVTRTGGTATGITVQYATEDITATGGAAAGGGVDYMTTSGTLTFLARETSKTFDVKIFNDAEAEAPETIRLKLSNPGGGATLGLAEAILTITSDDKAGVIQFSASTYTVTEGNTTAAIVVTRTGGTAAGVTVTYQTSDGTATAGQDYTAAGGTLSFGAGVTSLTFTVPVLGDDNAEGNETIRLTLSNPTAGATLGTPATAVLTILDDEQVIQFSSATYTVSEAGPNATITLVRSGSIVSAATVQFVTGNPGDTATAPDDYKAVNTTVTFAATSPTATVQVPIVNDTLVEGDETVTLTLSAPATIGGGAAPVLGPRSTATLTIVDNDLPGVIRFGQPVFTVQETSTGPSVVAAITITRALATTVAGQGLGSGVTVDFTTIDDTAIGGLAAGGGIDYMNQSTTVAFAAGEAKKTVNVTVFNDTLVESNENVILRLSNPTRGATLAPPTGAAPSVASSDASLLIVSDDRPGTFQFSSASYTTTEALGVTSTATLTVNRIGTAATLASGVTVDYQITGGTALLQTDYSLAKPNAAGGRLTFGAGVTSQTFNVTVQPDTGGEGPETVVLSLMNPSAGGTLGTPSTATLTINDAQTSVSFVTNLIGTPESGVVKLPIVRTGPVAGITSTVILTAVAGTATGGSDFTPTPPLAQGGVRVTFLPGVTSQTVSLAILPDAIPEGNEFFVAVLSNASANTTIGPVPSAFIIITDDDIGSFRFTSPTFTVKEGEPVAVVSVTRTGIQDNLAGTTTVRLSTVNGTALAGTDYTAVSNQLLTFGPSVTTQTFVIPITDNEVKDGARTFSVFLTPGTAGTAISAGGTATVTIQDND